MPKDTIPADDGTVSVGWTKDRDVQLGVERGPVVRYVGGAVAANMNVTAGGSSLFATLTDRAAVNRLIRSLRRARDAAFGADA